ncbi:hypothetical protein CLOM_g18217 [Closterium sp. NIES-68]|nr:hypothetical protein CLOM_g18217 [Closterium sp. NIES-68]
MWSAAGTASRPADAPEAEAAISRPEPRVGSKLEQRDEAELKTRRVGDEEGESGGGAGVDSEGGWSKSSGREKCEEEEAGSDCWSADGEIRASDCERGVGGGAWKRKE